LWFPGRLQQMCWHSRAFCHHEGHFVFPPCIFRDSQHLVHRGGLGDQQVGHCGSLGLPLNSNTKCLFNLLGILLPVTFLQQCPLSLLSAAAFTTSTSVQTWLSPLGGGYLFRRCESIRDRGGIASWAQDCLANLYRETSPARSTSPLQRTSFL